MNVRKRKPTPIPHLTLARVQKRLDLCRSLKNSNRKKVIFFDKSMFQLLTNKLKLWGSKKFPAKVPNAAFQQKQMIWGAFSFFGLSRLKFFEKNVDVGVYVQTLKDFLLPFLQQS